MQSFIQLSLASCQQVPSGILHHNVWSYLAIFSASSNHKSSVSSQKTEGPQQSLSIIAQAVSITSANRQKTAGSHSRIGTHSGGLHFVLPHPESSCQAAADAI
jgi:hypothetical protein